MDPTPRPARVGLLDRLSRVLHLHQLPRPDAPVSISKPMSSGSRPTAMMIPPVSPRAAPVSMVSSSFSPIPAPVRAVSPAPTPPARPITPSPAPVRAPEVTIPAAVSTPAHPGSVRIVTDYDRILDLVQNAHSIKLDEIARLLALKEEQVAQELQTLEDNGLIEVKYPAFGEPLISVKKGES